MSRFTTKRLGQLLIEWNEYKDDGLTSTVVYDLRDFHRLMPDELLEIAQFLIDLARQPSLVDVLNELDFHYSDEQIKEQHNAPRQGIVYMLRRSDGATKIGYTHHPKQRYSALQKIIGEPLEIIAEYNVSNPIRYEGYLHDLFSEYRLEGEWFMLPEEHLDLMEKYNEC